MTEFQIAVRALMTSFPSGDIISIVKAFKKEDATAARTAKAEAKTSARADIDAKAKALAAEAKAAGVPMRVLGPRKDKTATTTGVTA